MTELELLERISELKKHQDAVVIAHTYQLPEIQDAADFVGDSLELSMKVREVDAGTVVFCGVRFMAETAKIISPEKTVLMPDPGAGCPMADMITAEDVVRLKRNYPDGKVVCYVNSTADVKAESDICCTSSNAVRIVDSIPSKEQVIFIPDMNLGTYVKNKLSRDIILWPGHCSVHSSITAQEVLELKNKYPYAKVLAHPECRTAVLELSDYILSTSNMIRQVGKLDSKEYIILTEEGILYPLNKKYPDCMFHHPKRALCLNMKKTTIDLLTECLENRQHEITVPDNIRERAAKAVYNMLEI
ncbi:MAG: quinolinate synthase NadA [Oligoflexia bacterium]|nr:quinolinate synthase NadA [Oligoflexia bacterium]